MDPKGRITLTKAKTRAEAREEICAHELSTIDELREAGWTLCRMGIVTTDNLRELRHLRRMAVDLVRFKDAIEHGRPGISYCNAAVLKARQWSSGGPI